MKANFSPKAKFFFQQALCQKRAGENEAAIASLDKALLYQPDYADAWSQRGVILGKLGQHDEAIVNFDGALAIRPNAFWIWHNRGIALGKLGEYEAAINSFDRAIELNPDISTFGTTKALHSLTGDAIKKQLFALSGRLNYNQIATGHGTTEESALQLRRSEEALNSFDRAIEFKPDFFIAWHYRGITLSERGRYEKAIASYNRAIEINPDYEPVWYNKGIALEKLGCYLQAIACFRKVHLQQK